MWFCLFEDFTSIKKSVFNNSLVNGLISLVTGAASYLFCDLELSSFCMSEHDKHFSERAAVRFGGEVATITFGCLTLLYTLWLFKNWSQFKYYQPLEFKKSPVMPKQRKNEQKIEEGYQSDDDKNHMSGGEGATYVANQNTIVVESKKKCCF